MSGGAVDSACRAVREDLFERVARRHGLDPLRLAIDGRDVVDTAGSLRVAVAEAIGDAVLERTVEYHHRPTEELDESGQGNCHAAFAFTAHRAVVDVDPDLGLVRVVQVATAQDVGRALNPLSVLGQIEGGISQGLGLAVMEEIVQIDGRIRNASFTDYLLPTMLDMPPVVATLVEEPDPQAPLGAKGVGEPPCISVTPAIVAAIRDALRQADGHSRRADRITRVPVRPQDIALSRQDWDADSSRVHRTRSYAAWLTPHDVRLPSLRPLSTVRSPESRPPHWVSTRRRVATALRSGGLVEPVPNVLVFTDGPATWHQRLMVVVLAAGGHG